MNKGVRQGDILRIERIKALVLVTSKDFFNQTGEVIGCPLQNSCTDSPLHIKVDSLEEDLYAQCEKLALLDLSERRYSKVRTISISDVINISDAIQGIFDYI